MLQEINLVNFRNFGKSFLRFTGNNVVLTGANGSGKSNLLEAVNHLSILRSFRGPGLTREEIKIGCNSFIISGLLKKLSGSCEKLCVTEHLSGKRELSIGDCRVSKSSDFIGEFRCVPFVPEDLNIVNGHAGVRRRFFDMLISALDREYFFQLSSYFHALDQRNAALKSGNAQIASAFDQELATSGEAIVAKRAEFSTKIEVEMNKLLNGRFAFSCRYLPDVSGNAAAFRTKLTELREREMQKKHTLAGVQLDDFEFRFDDKKLRGYGSAGQRRISALMLRLAQFFLVKEKSSTPVIALIDDVTGELDERNFAHFIDCIGSADQRIYTFTALPDAPGFADMQVIDISEVEK